MHGFTLGVVWSKKRKSNRQVSLPRTSTNIPLSWCKQTFKTQNLIWEAAAKAAKSESSWIWLFLNSFISDWDYFDKRMEYLGLLNDKGNIFHAYGDILCNC